MELAQMLFRSAEFIGTIAFAVSGAMIAIDRKLDLFGILFLGIVTALGGGALRDILLGNFPPRMFYNYQYVTLATLSALAVFLAARRDCNRYWRNREKISYYINVFDAIGLGIFSVLGVETSIKAGYGDNGFMCIFLGMTTGVGGGILRDMMSHEIPYVLKKHVYAIAAIIGGAVYYALVRFHIRESAAMFAGMAIVIVIRLLATHYKWSLPRVFKN